MNQELTEAYQWLITEAQVRVDYFKKINVENGVNYPAIVIDRIVEMERALEQASHFEATARIRAGEGVEIRFHDHDCA